MQNACQIKKMARCQSFAGCHDVIQLSLVSLQKANYTMSVGRKKRLGHGRVINRLAFDCTDRKRFLSANFFPFQIPTRFKWACVIKKAFFSYPSKRE